MLRCAALRCAAQPGPIERLAQAVASLLAVYMATTELGSDTRRHELAEALWVTRTPYAPYRGRGCPRISYPLQTAVCQPTLTLKGHVPITPLNPQLSHRH